MGTAEGGKLGHAEKVNTDQEVEEERLRYKRAGYKPGGLDKSKPQIGFVEGLPEGQKVTAVACGDKHTVCVMEDGSVYSWGYGKMGPLGHNNNESITVPRKVEGLSNIVRVDCGTSHTIALDNNGKLYSFGDNTYG